LLPYQSFVSSKPSRYVQGELRKIPFDDDDEKYVAVANRAQGAYITHEVDKHLREQVRIRVRQTCGVEVMGRDHVRDYIRRATSASDSA